MKNTELTISTTKQQLTPEQQKFNKLLKQIEQLEAAQKVTDECMQLIDVAVNTDLRPLQAEYNQNMVEFIIALDAATRDLKLKRNEREGLDDYLLERSTDLLAVGHEEVRSVFNFYSDRDFEEVQAEENAAKTALFTQMARENGYEGDIPDNIDWNDEEQMMQFMHEIGEKVREAVSDKEYEKKTSTKKKTKTEIAQEQEEIELQALRRSIYLELVKLYHPDRFTDEAEKIEKGEVMKRITEAYENEDLLELFRLQIENQSAMSAENVSKMADERLRVINKSLKEKVSELKFQFQIDKQSAEQVAKMHIRSFTIPAVEYALKLRKKELRSNIENLKDDIQQVKTNKKFVKELAKSFAVRHSFANMFGF
jgi:hypothetical protein